MSGVVWARSIVLSVVLHVGGACLVTVLAWLPRLWGSERDSAGLQISWDRALAQAEPWDRDPEFEPTVLPEPEVEPVVDETEVLEWTEFSFPTEPVPDPEQPPEPLDPSETLVGGDAQEQAEPVEEASEAEAEVEPEPSGEAPDLGGDSDPVLEESTVPDYPRLARMRGWEGVVQIRLVVGVDGSVVEARVEQSSGHRVLDDAALVAVRGWRFRPGRAGGRAVEREVLHHVRFVIGA